MKSGNFTATRNSHVRQDPKVCTGHQLSGRIYLLSNTVLGVGKNRMTAICNKCNKRGHYSNQCFLNISEVSTDPSLAVTVVRTEMALCHFHFQNELYQTLRKSKKAQARLHSWFCEIRFLLLRHRLSPPQNEMFSNMATSPGFTSVFLLNDGKNVANKVCNQIEISCVKRKWIKHIAIILGCSYPLRPGFTRHAQKWGVN